MKLRFSDHYINFPDDLSEETINYLRKLLRKLSEGSGSVIDDSLLILLAGTHETYLAATRKLNEEGHFAGDRPNPAIKVMKDSQTQLTKLLIELNRSSKKNPIKKEEPQSPIEKFINSKREIR